jgi:CRP-like cAMP-binding protein
MSLTSVLKGQQLFQALTAEEIALTDRVSSVKKFDQGESVYRCDAPARHFFVLLKGAVHLQLPAAEGEFSLIISKVGPGSLLGLAALVGTERYTATARCAEPCEVLAIEAKQFRELLSSNPRVDAEIMASVARSYSDRYVEILRRLQNILNQIPIIP